VCNRGRRLLPSEVVGRGLHLEPENVRGPRWCIPARRGPFHSGPLQNPTRYIIVSRMMGHREKLRGATEWDYLTRTRRYFFKRAGKFVAVKRAFNKRVRRDAKRELHR